MQLLRRLVLHKFVDSSQVVFIDDFVLFSFGTIVDSFVKILSKEVTAFEFPFGSLFDCFFLFLHRFAPRSIESHSLFIYFSN